MKKRSTWALGGLLAVSMGVFAASGVRAQQGSSTAAQQGSSAAAQQGSSAPAQQSGAAVGQQGSSAAAPQGGAAGQPAGEPRVDPNADAILRKMSDYLSSLKAFDVTADYAMDMVTSDGEKHTYGARSLVQIERPNHMRSERRGQLADLAFFYDGKTVTLLGRRANLYATAPAPPTLDATIDFTRDRLGIEAPAADLLYSDPYRTLMEDVVSGKYLGMAEVNGVPCHHLAYRGNETDWQLWVQDGPQPLPCKYVIVSKKMTSAPQFEVELHDWTIEKDIPDQTFHFTPPAGAKQIDFLGMEQQGANPQKGKGGK